MVPRKVQTRRTRRRSFVEKEREAVEITSKREKRALSIFFSHVAYLVLQELERGLYMSFIHSFIPLSCREG